jgi:HD-GYP domain-containing protein (c-di-GMP phosphodiesterase class II)
MSSHRPYRPALGLEAVIEETIKNKDKLYDSKVVEACQKVFSRGFVFE